MRTFIFCISIIFSLSTMAIDDHTGGYSSKKPEILSIIEQDPHFAFSYGLLRHAHELRDHNFIKDARDIWKLIKNKEYRDKEEIYEAVRVLATTHWDKLNQQQKKIPLYIMPMKKYTGGYISNNLNVCEIIYKNDDAAFIYGIYRRALEGDNKEFKRLMTNIWKYIIDNPDIYVYNIALIVKNYWKVLTPAQQNLAHHLGYAPTIWERCELRMGAKATALLKVGAACAIICCVAAVPVAAAIAPLAGSPLPEIGGTIQNSCHNISTEAYNSTDTNIGDIIRIRAQCAGDRTQIKDAEAFIHSHSICNKVHNDNGSLIVDSSNYHFGALQFKPESCPDMSREVGKKCSIKGTEYRSSDTTIPNGAFCLYTARCPTRNHGERVDLLYISNAAAGCEKSKNLYLLKEGGVLHSPLDPCTKGYHCEQENPFLTKF